MKSVIRSLIVTGVLGSALALTNNNKDILVPALEKRLSEVTAAVTASKKSSENSLILGAEQNTSAQAPVSKEDLELDLREIKERGLVELINDPRSNSAAKEDAIAFMNEYLRKLTEYMRLRNQELTALAEKHNG